jgi:precorrin-2 dehydrogenase/sirohydrochlorin ferrochelatase
LYAGRTDIGDASLVIAATDSAALNKEIAVDAMELGRLVNVVDAPDSGSFVSMAVHRKGALTIGVGTGAVPSAAVRIRNALAERFDERYAEAVSAAAALRSDVLASDGVDGWARIHPRLIAADFCQRVENGTFNEELSACR